MEKTIEKEIIIMKEKNLVVKFTSTEETDFQTVLQRVMSSHAVHTK